MITPANGMLIERLVAPLVRTASSEAKKRPPPTLVCVWKGRLTHRVEVNREESAWNIVAIGIHCATQEIQNVAAIEIHADARAARQGFQIEQTRLQSI